MLINNFIKKTKKIIINIILVLAICLFAIPTSSLADGIYIPQPGYYVYETDQQAAIFFDNSQESMVLSTSYYGNAKEFTWIVPTPTEPQVAKISKDFFTNLEKMTEVKETMTPRTYVNSQAESGKAALDVTVIDEKKIGYYDLKILQSTDKDALFNYLKENNYSYPEEGKYILEDYIRLGWTFTAIKINEDALKDANINNKLNSGNISPLKFTFSTDKPVYPLKISGIAQYTSNHTDNLLQQVDASTGEPVPSVYPNFNNSAASITLYVFSSRKKELNSANFNIIYANWIKAKDINNLGFDEQGNSWVDANKKYFLTKIFGTMTYSQMDDDLYLQDATNNKTVGVPSWYESFLTNLSVNMIWYIAAILVMFFIPIIWQFRQAGKITRIICWTSQIISFCLKISLIVAVSSYIYSSYLSDFHGAQYWYSWYQWYDSSVIILFTYFLPVGMIIVLLSELLYQIKYLKK